MNPALAAVLSNPAIWRGGDCAPEPAALPSGFPALDAMLPGRGWPGGALTEIVLEREGIGEIRLVLPALARLQAQGRDVAWIAPPHVPYAPALIAAGLDLGRLLIVRCRSSADQLWAYEQALRAPECGAAFAWLGAARRAPDAQARRRRARRPHVGRALAASRPACDRRHRIAAALARAARRPARGARAEAPRRRSRAAGHRRRTPLQELTHASLIPLAHHFFTMACNNAWANHRLLDACGRLSQDDFVARRTSFFPTLKATLNHNLTVDWYYVDALERALRGEPPNRDVDRFFDPEEPCATCAELAPAQRAVDLRLVAACATLTDDALAAPVPVMRRAGIMSETATRLLAHLFQHQIHHRGQAHAMLAGTPVKPPQLDEFFCANEAHLRAAELALLGLSEAAIWGEPRGEPSAR